MDKGLNFNKSTDMLDCFKRTACISKDFREYAESVSSVLAILCMGAGREPKGSGRRNFIKGWERRHDYSIDGDGRFVKEV